MSVEENKVLVRHWYDLFDRRDLDALYALVDPGYVFHSVDGDLTAEQAEQHEREWIGAFPDIRGSIVDMVAEGDKVAVRVNYKATHLGGGFGREPTGKPIDITNATTFRIADGKIVEAWNVCDLRLLMQLGPARGE